MGYAERQEYFFLVKLGRWTPERIKRLQDLRVWKNAARVPDEFRSIADWRCTSCGEGAPEGWFTQPCPRCEFEDVVSEEVS